MTEPVLRVADVADEIVHSYLYRLASLVELDLISEVFFRVTPGRSSIPMEIGLIHPVEPTFEVLVFVSRSSPGLAGKLSQAASAMAGNVRVLPEAALAGEWTREDLERGQWKQVAMPVTNVPQQLAGV